MNHERSDPVILVTMQVRFIALWCLENHSFGYRQETDLMIQYSILLQAVTGAHDTQLLGRTLLHGLPIVVKQVPRFLGHGVDAPRPCPQTRASPQAG